MSVMTVLGKIDAKDMGVTTPHEHIFIDMKVFFTEPEEIGAKQLAYSPVTIDKLGILKRNCFALLDNVQMMDYETQKKEIEYFKLAGGKTVVDASNIGLGRDPELMRRISIETGLNVVIGSGYYVEGAQKPEVLDLTIEQMEENIVNEFKNGIGHTGIKPGFIGEIGVGHVMMPFEKKSLIAACRAQKRTGAPLMIHINPWSTQGREAMEIVKEHEIDPKKVVICHVDVENREDYIFELLEMGVYIEFDNFGKENDCEPWEVRPGNGPFVTDRERVALIKKIIDRGYVKQLLFSTDICLKSLLHSYGGWGYDHVITNILPVLRYMGVTQEQIDEIMIHNPARWLDYDC